MITLLNQHQSVFFLRANKLIYDWTTAPQRFFHPPSHNKQQPYHMMPCLALWYPDLPHYRLLPKSKPQSLGVWQLCSVCRAGCTTDNNAASRTLSHTHSCGPGGGGGGGGDLTSGAQQALSTSPPPPSLPTTGYPLLSFFFFFTYTTSFFFSHTRRRTWRPI